MLTILQGGLNRCLGFSSVCFLCVLVVMELMIGDCMVIIILHDIRAVVVGYP